MSTFDSDGNLHGDDGRFAPQQRPEVDADLTGAPGRLVVLDRLLLTDDAADEFPELTFTESADGVITMCGRHVEVRDATVERDTEYEAQLVTLDFPRDTDAARVLHRVLSNDLTIEDASVDDGVLEVHLVTKPHDSSGGPDFLVERSFTLDGAYAGAPPANEIDEDGAIYDPHW